MTSKDKGMVSICMLALPISIMSNITLTEKQPFDECAQFIVGLHRACYRDFS